MIKELGIMLMKTSIFYSDTMLKRAEDLALLIGWIYFLMMLIFLITQLLSIGQNQNKISKYSLIVFPLLIITQFCIFTLVCILCLQICYFSIIPLILYVITCVSLSNENDDISIYGITTTVCTYFNKLRERDVLLKQYNIDYQNTIKKSETLWKTHKLS